MTKLIFAFHKFALFLQTRPNVFPPQPTRCQIVPCSPHASGNPLQTNTDRSDAGRNAAAYNLTAIWEIMSWVRCVYVYGRVWMIYVNIQNYLTNQTKWCNWQADDIRLLLLLLSVLFLFYYYYYYYYIEFLASQLWLGNIHLSWDVVINRIRLGGLICSSKSLLLLLLLLSLIRFTVTPRFSLLCTSRVRKFAESPQE